LTIVVDLPVRNLSENPLLISSLVRLHFRMHTSLALCQVDKGVGDSPKRSCPDVIPAHHTTDQLNLADATCERDCEQSPDVFYVSILFIIILLCKYCKYYSYSKMWTIFQVAAQLIFPGSPSHS